MSRPLLTVAALFAIVLPARADADFLGKSARDWAKELADPKPQVRRGAAFALGKCATVGAVPNLVRALDDADAGVRDAAAFALGEIAAGRRDRALWDKVGGPLRKVLTRDNDARARRSAACALGQFGPDAAAAREDLQAALEHKDPAVRQNAAWALGRLKEQAAASGVERLAKALGDDDAAVRRDAAAALGEIGRPTAISAVRPLVDCLGREKADEVRAVAVRSVVNLAGPEHKEAAAGLRDFLKKAEGPELRRDAAVALAKTAAPEAKEAVPVLVKALEDEDAAVREQAASALGSAGASAAEAVPALGKALSDPATEVRRNAALALTHVGPRAGEAMRPLLGALATRETAEVRQYAAEAIGSTEGAVNTVVPELLAVLKDDRDQQVRQRLAFALQYVRPFAKSETARVLENILDEKADDSRLVRYNAARVLAFKLGDEAPAKVVVILEDMLNNTRLREYKGTDPTLNKGDESVKGGTGAKENLGGDARHMAAVALARVARSGKRDDALKVLRGAAESNDEVKKKVAAEALKEIGRR